LACLAVRGIALSGNAYLGNAYPGSAYPGNAYLGNAYPGISLIVPSDLLRRTGSPSCPCLVAQTQGGPPGLAVGMSCYVSR
jgi:hypothetical protein